MTSSPLWPFYAKNGNRYKIRWTILSTYIKKKEETQSFAPLGLLFGNRYGYNTPNQSQALFCSNENVEI
jgi:hypothetical protein